MSNATIARQPTAPTIQVSRSADRSLGAAAEQLEVRVEARDGGAAREVPDDPADRQQPAQRDDERGHADVGDDEALERPDRQRRGEAEGQGDETSGRGSPADAEDVRQPVGHQQRVGHGDDADERPDREVDVARHDDEDHAGRDDATTGRLDRQRHHVRRLEELAAAQDLEGEQDQPRGRRACRTAGDRSPSAPAGPRERGPSREARPDSKPVPRPPRSSRRAPPGADRSKRPAPPGCPGDAGWIA